MSRCVRESLLLLAAAVTLLAPRSAGAQQAAAARVEACKFFTPADARTLLGVEPKLDEDIGNSSNGRCVYTGKSAQDIVSVDLWQLATPEAASTYLTSMLKQGGAFAPIPGLGQEAYSAGFGMMIWVRKGSRFIGVGSSLDKQALEKMARALADRL